MKLSLCSGKETLYIIFDRAAARIAAILAIILALQTVPLALADEINAYTQHQYPLQFKEQGRLTGFSVEVVNRLFELAGDSGNISVMPWAKAYNTVLREPNTMLFSVARNKIPEKQFHWVGTLAKQKVYFWGLKSQFKQSVAAIEELKQHRTTIMLNSDVYRYLVEKGFHNLHKVTDSKANIITMYRGQTDLMLDTFVGVRQSAKALKLELDKIIHVSELGALDTDLNIAFNKNSNLALVSRYRNALRKLKRSGELAALAKEWKIVVEK